jgi:hypothetical protein
VEDYGNVDQLNLFADSLWRTGATIVAFRPLGHRPIERVLDNTDRQHVKFDGPWFDSTSPIYFGSQLDDVPYKFAIAATTETARARFRPYIPKTDYYPVYCWARDGADRVAQTYRVRHAGGLTEITVDHRAVGKGWVFLGEYYLTQGWDNYVEITNKVDDPILADGRHVVVADAIRFGNGMGDANRGGGISGFPREEEASRYWVDRMLPVGAPPIHDTFEGSDQNTNVGAPPRMAAYMNREAFGSFTDRIYLGFHTNAVGGRGAVGLFCKDPDKRPDGQVEFAELVARQLNEDMTTTRSVRWPTNWTIHKKLTDSHINFGEIRRDALNNEMCATILEVAFHDNALDAMLIRDPRFRQLVADSATKAILRFLKAQKAALVADDLPPDAPVLLSAIALTSQSICLKWRTAHDGTTPMRPIRGYRIYHSVDGFAFGSAVEVGETTGVIIDNLKPAIPHFFKVCALNECGESRPSEVLGAWSGEFTTAPRHLIVYGFTTFSEDVVVSQTVHAGLGSPLRGGGEFVRIIPRKMNARNYVAHWGRALASAGAGFDSCTMEGLQELDSIPASYSAVMLALGKQSPTDWECDETTLRSLEKFREGGGALVLSGTNLIKCLEKSMKQSYSEPSKKRLPRIDWLTVRATTESLSASLVTWRGLDRTKAVDYVLDSGEGDAYRATGCDGLQLPKASVLMTYSGDKDQASMLLLKRTSSKGPVMLAGFPLECVQPAEQRASLFRQIEALIGKPQPTAKPTSAKSRQKAGKR